MTTQPILGMDTFASNEVARTLVSIRTENGANLLTLAEKSPVLLVFLRHFGCSFCRKAISDISELQDELARRRVRPVFVHLGPPELAQVYFEYYGLDDVDRICDPQANIYQFPIFQLARVHWMMHFIKPAVVIGWFKGAIFKHGIGKIQGDGHQMPGIFFIKGPEIVRRFIYKTIADQPDYLKLVS